MSKVKMYLQVVDEVIAAGPFKANWESLSNVLEPQWYKDAKFGIFIHWGVYSVPAFGSEWYPRNMYLEGNPCYDHHIETYGAHKDFQYEDFIPMFKAEKYDPAAWAQLFKDSGAKFVMPVAEHHDGFQMYESELSDWNAVKMGPKRDLISDLKIEVEKEEMIFTASNHRAENFWFMNGARDFDSGLNKEGYIEPYGYRTKVDGTASNPSAQAEYPGKVPKAHLEDWLARLCEFVDKYEPKIIWFDWWIENSAFKPYLKKFAAYYYNRGVEWGVDVAINYKNDAYAKGTAIFDMERGQLSDINPRFWQTDTAVAKNSWSYTVNNDFKNPEAIVGDLIDIVSKNGALLLNIGPKADGTISKEDENILRAVGKWLKANGESIYDTTFWSVYGEGPTDNKEGTFQEKNRQDYKKEDIRYTYKAPYIYAHVLKWPEDGKATLKSMAKGSKFFRGLIKEISLLSYKNQVTYTRDQEGLHLAVDESIKTPYPVTFKIKID